MIYTAKVGNNAELIRDVCSLYVNDGDTVADITYGKGSFWKKVSVNVTGSDIATCKHASFDFTKRLPYEDCQFDHCVFDPPYVHTPGEKFQKEKMYANSETHKREKTTEKYHKAVTQRYRLGMSEAARITRAGGFVWVKCQDEVCSSLQWWTHIEVYEAAKRLGLYARDLFVLVQSTNPTVQHKAQQHARKNHSYLWVFEKPDAKRLRQVMRAGA